MSLETFSSINSIIQLDSAVTPYKYSLLQSIIETCQEYPQFVKLNEETHRVQIPYGICVFKWIFYYYPFFIPGKFIALENGEEPGSQKNISFRDSFERVCQHYQEHGGISVLYNEILHGKVDSTISFELLNLIRTMRTAIIEGPIKHTGNSQKLGDYSIFKKEKKMSPYTNPSDISLNTMVAKLGEFSFSEDLYYVFRSLGGYILGTETLYQKFLEFVLKNNTKYKDIKALLLQRMDIVPQTERDVAVAKEFYHKLLNRNGCRCFWSNKPVSGDTLVIDHMLPFSLWKSNDLWNLLPAKSSVNLDKSDKIPSPEQLIERKEKLFKIWDNLHSEFKEQFESEISVGLLSGKFDKKNWKEEAFQQLINNVDYLINVRGYTKWDIKSEYKKK